VELAGTGRQHNDTGSLDAAAGIGPEITRGRFLDEDVLQRCRPARMGADVAVVSRTAADANDEQQDDDSQQRDRDLRVQSITLSTR